jgi:antitoxin component YwqK of YwqJK toxin-antitoxin module
MSKSFTHAGVSKLDGKFKVRYCNDSLRTKVLIKNGHTDIDIVELKHPMTKEEVVTYLLSIDFDNGNKEVRAALEAEQGKREPKAPKSTGKVEKVKAVKATAKKAVKPTLESIKAKAKVPATAKSKAEVQAVLDAAEDAPF